MPKVKELALKDKSFFARWPLGVKVPLHQKQWYDFLDYYHNFLLFAPADHGKSTVLNIAILQEIIKNRNIRVILASNRDDLAERNGKWIRKMLENNKTITDSYGQFKGSDKWSDIEFTVDRPNKFLADSTVYTCGAGSQSLGRRGDLIVCDDILDKRNSDTAEKRRKIKAWFWDELYPCLEDDGRFWLIGNFQHLEDLYSELINDPDFFYVVQRAIRDEVTQEVLWPKKWSYEKLNKRRKKNYVSFMKRYQNVLVESKELWVSRDLLNPLKDRTRVIRRALASRDNFDFISVGLDPAYTTNKQSKFSALVVLGVKLHEGEPTFELIYAWKDKLSYDPMKVKVENVTRQLLADKLTIETNQAQRALFEDLEKKGLPVMEHYTTAKKHDVREGLPAITGLVIDKKIILPYGNEETKVIVDSLIDEMVSYPEGKYSDLLMALYFALKGTDRMVKAEMATVSYRKTVDGGQYGIRRLNAFKRFRQRVQHLRSA